MQIISGWFIYISSKWSIKTVWNESSTSAFLEDPGSSTKCNVYYILGFANLQ